MDRSTPENRGGGLSEEDIAELECDFPVAGKLARNHQALQIEVTLLQATVAGIEEKQAQVERRLTWLAVAALLLGLAIGAALAR